MKDQKPKKKKLRWLKWSLAVLALAVMIYSGVNIALFYLQAAEARDNQQQTLQTYVIIHQPEETEAPTIVEPSPTEDPDPIPDVEALRYEVDFDALQQTNPEVCAWLTIPALEGVDFPMVWCGDDDKYLRKAWDGSYSYFGSIFIEGMNTNDFLDYHTIAYGHNMQDGTMLGSMEQFGTEEFYRSHSPYVVVHTPEESILYEIFSVEYVDSYSDDVYKVAYEDYDEYVDFVSRLKERSIYDTGVEITEDDMIFTVSTCAYIFNNARFVIHAKQIWRGSTT